VDVVSSIAPTGLPFPGGQLILRRTERWWFYAR